MHGNRGHDPDPPVFTCLVTLGLSLVAHMMRWAVILLALQHGAPEAGELLALGEVGQAVR